MTPEEEWRVAEAHEERVAKVLEIRNRGKTLRWWDSPGLTALASSVAGAVVAFAGSYVLNAQERDTKRAVARVEQMRQGITQANDALASMLKANEERLLLATGKLDDLDTLQRREIARGTNRIQQQWRQQKENAEIGIMLSFAGDTIVTRAWSNARDALEKYTDCMETAYIRFQRRRAPSDVCSVERAGTLNSVAGLRSRLTHAYTAAVGEIP